MQTTVGQLLINEALPQDLRDPNRVLDKKGLFALLEQLALKHPDRYREVSKQLADIGREVSTESGGNSFGLAHMRRAKAAKEYRLRVQAYLRNVLNDDKLSDEDRRRKIIDYLAKIQPEMVDKVLDESLQEENPLAYQVISGARGNKNSLSSLRASDLLYSDHRQQAIPLPVLRSYSEGLSPIEYWAGTYGARQGVMATKFAVQEAGFLSKQLNQAAHRLIVDAEDEPDTPDQPKSIRGIPVDTDDVDNEGAFLAQDVGGYKRNTILTPKILKHLSRQGISKILVRSPIAAFSPEGRLYARDVGLREGSRIPGRGEAVGLTAAQALSEPISQGQLNVKHTGGVASQSKAVSGFDLINSLVQGTENFRGAAAHAEVDGKVEKIEPAPAGGQFVTISGKRHYVPPDLQLKVKPGQEIEAGDVLSEGIPQPALIVQHKGIGEGRLYFAQSLRQAMKDANLKSHRRNIELIARGLVDHVRLTEEWEDYAPDDIVSYAQLEKHYQPREGFQKLAVDRALGKYLERPVLHYTIGTKIRPSMLSTLRQFGVNEVEVHDQPPPFEPEFVRGMANLQHDSDWITRMYGSGLKTSLLRGAQRGATSDENSTSFVPSLARGVDFGKHGLVRQPEPGQLVLTDENGDAKVQPPKKKTTPGVPAPAPSANNWLLKLGDTTTPTAEPPSVGSSSAGGSGGSASGSGSSYRPNTTVGRGVQAVQTATRSAPVVGDAALGALGGPLYDRYVQRLPQPAQQFVGSTNPSPFTQNILRNVPGAQTAWHYVSHPVAPVTPPAVPPVTPPVPPAAAPPASSPAAVRYLRTAARRAPLVGAAVDAVGVGNAAYEGRLNEHGLHRLEELQSDLFSLPSSENWYGIRNVLEAVPAVVNVPSNVNAIVQGSREIANEVGQLSQLRDQNVEAARQVQQMGRVTFRGRTFNRNEMNLIGILPAYQRWIRAGRPEGTFTDPTTNQQYTAAQLMQAEQWGRQIHQARLDWIISWMRSEGILDTAPAR